MIGISLDMSAWIDELDGLARRASDLEPANRLVSEVLVGATHRNFDTQGADGDWDPLASSTVEERAREGRTGPPLVKTGALRNSLKGEATRDYAGVYSELPYAEAQFARRDPFGLRPEDEEQISGIYLDHLAGGR